MQQQLKKKRFFDFVRKNYKKIRRLFFFFKYITLYRTLFKIQKRGFAIFTNMATCLRERKRERVSFSLLEREDHVRSVCMFVCVCVCVICYHVNQKKGVMEYVIELSGVDPLLKRVELKSAIIKKRLILEELNNKLKESEL